MPFNRTERGLGACGLSGGICIAYFLALTLNTCYSDEVRGLSECPISHPGAFRRLCWPWWAGPNADIRRKSRTAPCCLTRLQSVRFLKAIGRRGKRGPLSGSLHYQQRGSSNISVGGERDPRRLGQTISSAQCPCRGFPSPGRDTNLVTPYTTPPVQGRGCVTPFGTVPATKGSMNRKPIVTVCAWCKPVLRLPQLWAVSHGICPGCRIKYFPGLTLKPKGDKVPL